MTTHAGVRPPPSLPALAQRAHALRCDVVRMVAATGQGYVQQGLGAADLFAVLYAHELRFRAGEPLWPERDRFLLSTAHNSAIFGAALASAGLIDRALLESYCLDGSPYEINMSERLGPVVEATCGSLGQGLSVAVGMALSAQRQCADWRSYVMLGDGELQEGQVWEATMAAGHYGLGNLCMLIDWNEMQVEGHVDQVMRMQPVADKFRAFQWAAEEIDGHDLGAIVAALQRARDTADRPTVIIARTLVGKGAPCLEGIFGHNMRLPAAMAEQALAQLRASAPAEEVAA
ncbi:MAG: transketolase [Gammaproteobacteria bacterium]|nr:transketolase [Gammaproteobacteria bacterium]